MKQYQITCMHLIIKISWGLIDSHSKYMSLFENYLRFPSNFLDKTNLINIFFEHFSIARKGKRTCYIENMFFN